MLLFQLPGISYSYLFSNNLLFVMPNVFKFGRLHIRVSSCPYGFIFIFAMSRGKNALLCGIRRGGRVPPLEDVLQLQ